MTCFCPHIKDFSVIEDERIQKIFTLKKLKSEDYSFISVYID